MSQFHPEDASGSQNIVSNQDVVLASDRDQTGAGDIVFKTGGVERARIKYDGTGTGWSNVLGGSQTSAHYDPRLQWLGMSLKRLLVAADQSFSIAWLTDSTGNDIIGSGHSGDWPYELATQIAAAYPAWTVKFPVWADGTQDYAAPTIIQTGTAGDRYVRIPGTGHSLTLPSALVGTPPTNLDVAVLSALDSWTPAANNALCSHDVGGSRGWYLEISATTGRPLLAWSADGSTFTTVTCSAAPVIANGSPIWIRATLQVNNGAGGYVVKFYTSPATDGATWTQLGTTTTGGATTTLFNSTGAYTLGSRSGSATDLITGNVYEIRLRQGIQGIDAACQTILPCYAEQWEPWDVLSPSAVTGAPVLTLFAGAMPGQGLSYLSNATRLPLLLPLYSLRAVFMATSHNDGNAATDASYFASWASWITAVKAQAPEAVPVVTTENPEVTGSSSTAQGIRAHTMRREKLLTFAQQLDLPTLDGWQAFVDTGAVASYIQADGIHPTLVTGVTPRTGAQTWADDAYKALFAGA